ncbi:MAG: acyl-CoA dehydratase activase [Gemmatimonadota bacterium]|nr:acyl-CoA dehydratase activase [Gemmatimonadota bacterium]
MTLVAGIDIGSTYTKCTVLDREEKVVGKAMLPTGFRLAEAAEKALDEALREAGALREDLGYTVATGFGRHQNEISDVQVTDLTASARGVAHFFPKTQTILDVGGQTMKASRLTDNAKVKSFRLNDKCAAGTGAFLEKTARYMGFSTEEIGPLVSTSKEAVSISGVCAVFAESEVINQLSEGSAPADIMRGAMVSLVGRSLQLMKRVKMEPEFTLIGGIMRFPAMVEIVKEELAMDVNVPEGDLVQFTSAFGAALLGRKRVEKRKSEGAASGV